MADTHNTEIDERAKRIARWLAENKEFEQHGVSEGSLASALGMSEQEVTEAVDHLEEREAVVRIPHGLSAPPQFTLKAGRGWPDIKNEL